MRDWSMGAKGAKQCCHQIERAQEKRLVRKELDEVHLD